MSNDVKKKASEKVANDKVRTIKKEINELIRPLAQALERLQALRCSVDSVFNFLQGSFYTSWCFFATKLLEADLIL